MAADRARIVSMWLDGTNGYLYARYKSFMTILSTEPVSAANEDAYGYYSYQIVRFGGLPTLFEILQSYTPSAWLGFRVPYMPEGLPAAHHFDTYYGPLTKPLDFSQAQPLQCDYPASPPSVGDYLEVADTVPTPPQGQGVYYVTAVAYQGQTRFGRKASGGVLSGRDPAGLAACTLAAP